jgi:hypothetical protein
MLDHRFDIVCVFFDGDRTLQEIQARTIGLFIDEQLVNNVIFVFNEDRTMERETFFRDRVLPRLGNFIQKHKLYFAEDISSGNLDGSGWRTQQALKLAIARKVSSRLYMVLDAKNHFIRQVVKADLFGPRNLPRSFWARPTGNLTQCFIKTCAVFEIDPEPYMLKAMPATTPYMMYTEHVLGAIDYLEFKEGANIDAIFTKRNRYLTEFFSYFAYLVSRTTGPDELYDFGRRTAISLFTRWPLEEAVADETLRKLSGPSITTFGLHRNRIPQLTDGQKEMIVSLWLQRGIASNREEAVGWLA